MISALSKILSLLNLNQRRRLAALVGMIAAGALLETAGIGLIFPYIAVIQDPGLIRRHALARSAYELLGTTDRRFLLWCGFGLLGFYVAKNALLAAFQKFQFRFIYNLQACLARRMMTLYLYSPYPFHVQNNSAAILSNLHEALNSCHLFLVPALTMAAELAVVIVMTSFLIYLNPLQTAASMLICGAISFLFLRPYRSRLKAWDERRHLVYERMLKAFNEAFGAIKETKVRGCEPFFLQNYLRELDEFSDNEHALKFLQVLPRHVMETVAVSLMLCVLLTLFIQGMEPRAVLPSMVVFALTVTRLLPSLNRIIGTLVFLRSYRSSVDIVHRDISGLEPVMDPVGAGGPDRRMTLRETIELRDVVFQYAGAGEATIRGLSLVIRKGQFVALVGTSGVGKSTVADILMGLLRPASGEVLADGKDVFARLSEWRANIGYIPQTVYLFDTTIRRNVAFGRPDAEIEDERVWAALRSAQLEAFVRRLPDGLDSTVGERGVRISGGERQRIGIARALYHDPDVLVLDEPTSALDYATEQAITQTIDLQKGAKTIIIIAHRPSTIRSCDAVYRIENGRLSETVPSGDRRGDSGPI